MRCLHLHPLAAGPCSISNLTSQWTVCAVYQFYSLHPSCTAGHISIFACTAALHTYMPSNQGYYDSQFIMMQTKEVVHYSAALLEGYVKLDCIVLHGHAHATYQIQTVVASICCVQHLLWGICSNSLSCVLSSCAKVGILAKAMSAWCCRMLQQAAFQEP